MSRKTYIAKTLGCKANLYDSQLLEAELQKRGWKTLSDDSTDVDICIVNSCTVTDAADKQSRKLAQRLSRRYPNAKIVMTGCGAEVNPQKYLDSPGVDFVVGNQDKPTLIDLATTAFEKNLPSQVLGDVLDYEAIQSQHPEDREWPMPEPIQQSSLGLSQKGQVVESFRTRAFLKIQEGCDSFCTFCIIPYGRGPARSLRPKEIVSQVRQLISEGVREIVLTGTNIGQYGFDWNSDVALEELIDTVLSQTELERLRVSSLDPTEITPGIRSFVEKFSGRFCPHFHVSLQSPHSDILRGMKRRYRFEEVQESLEKISQLSSPEGGVFVGMDLIAGFPGETEEVYQQTLDALKALPWSRIHVFPYSEREGTPATRMKGGVPFSERKRRTQEIHALSVERLERQSRKILKSLKERSEPIRSVLVEGACLGPDGTRDWMGGYSPNYLRVLLPKKNNESLQNQVVDLWPRSIAVDRSAGDVVFLATPHSDH